MASDKSMSARRFNRVALMCGNWSERSKNVARALLVDGESLSSVAKTYEMSTNQASVIRKRFMDKDSDDVTDRVKAFMQREEPQGITAQLAPYQSDIETLRDKGYTIEQIVAFLNENGRAIDADAVIKFLELTGHENTHPR